MTRRAASPPQLADVLRISKQSYAGGPWLARKMQHWRPYICPFEVLTRFVPQGCSLLDVGCGSGLFILLLLGLDRDIQAVGIDSSRPALAMAQRAAARLAAGGKNFAPPRFLVSPPHQRAALEAALDRVKPGGVLLFKDMPPRPLPQAVANRLHDLVVSRQWVHYVPVDDIQEWGAARGFRLEHREIIQRLWYVHDLAVLRRPEMTSQ